MFVRKFVEKASLKKPGGQLDGLKPDDLNPRTVFHYGTPAWSVKLAYDSVQKIIAVATRNGQIKLFGHNGSQVLLESDESISSKFLQFIENRGILINVTDKNHIEVWDVDGKFLSHVQVLKEDITSFTVLQNTFYMYVGDSAGNISVLKLDPEACCLVRMKYSIPFSASHGNPTDVAESTAVVHILQQPFSESKRILIVFKDGLATLWDVHESKAIFAFGKSPLQPLKETKEVTSACWACPFGSRVVLGYSNGELSIWEIPPSSSTEQKFMESQEIFSVQTAPVCKLNLGYKIDKNPIASLKWSYGDGKASKLYIMGAADATSSTPPQVLLLNEHTDSRMAKLGLHLPEACFDMEIVASSIDQNKPRQEYLLLLGRSGHMYVYDNYTVEKYLVQSQTKSAPSLPKEVVPKLPFGDSILTAAKIITNQQRFPDSADEARIFLMKNNASFLPFMTPIKDGTSTHFDGFAKIQNLYITGHSNGIINFWDVSCPILLPLVSLRQQNEEASVNDVAVTTLFYDGKSRLLVSGDQSGTINIFKFKPEPFSTENNFLSLQGNTKKGGSHIVHSIKLFKVIGAATCISKCQVSKHFAIGSDQGYVSVIDIDGPTLIYQKHIPSEICAGIISLHFQRCLLHGFEKNALVVATKDSSVLAVESNSGNALGTNPIQPKIPSKALFMKIFDGNETNESRSNVDGGFLKEETFDNGGPNKQQSVLFCSEKAVYVYSLTHILQGVKKVCFKKKFNSTSCFWASTFCSSTDEGLVLLFASGKMEIRSLPNLSLLKETYIRGFTVPPSNPNISTTGAICSSQDGEIILVRGDQGIHFLSVLHDSRNYRYLDSISHVYQKHISQRPVVDVAIIKEKRKGIFSSVMKDLTGSRAKHVPESEAEDLGETLTKLDKTFCTANFHSDTENTVGAEDNEDESEINIDDIDLDDILEKPKGHSKVAALNTDKLANKFQAFKGKLKSMKVKTEKNLAKDEPQDEKNGAIDLIKKKYGFSSSTESSIGAARMAQSKLSENLRKLQGINQKTAEMNYTARSFSSMAKEVLRAEQGKQ